MYLKRLELKGFKSFADRTILDFNNGVACVVGPNGSGKSNITDAVRWVLGEQKVKTLRGAKMEDIIFSGTTHRSALGMAEVSLHFDNNSQYFPVDYSEVIVTRRIYKSGESEYLLNNTPCRLKDVRELFMDTGIGTDGYSIIGQGKIESILSGNGDDRRQVFEEAAGIVKYKAKKKEAVKKLENTELNLIRVEDIAGELKGRIEPLRKESEKAKEYAGLSEELKDIEINLFLTELDKLDAKILNVVSSESEQTKLLESVRENQSVLETALKEIEGQLYNFESTQNEYHETYRIESDAFAKADGDINVAEERIKAFNNDLTRLEMESKYLEEQLVFQNTQLQLQVEERDKLVSANETAAKAHAVAETAYSDKAEQLKVLSAKYEGARSQIVEKLNEIERAKSDGKHLIDNRERYIQQKREIAEETESLKNSETNFFVRLQDIEAKYKEKHSEKESCIERYAKINAEEKEINQIGLELQKSVQSAQVAYEKTKTEHRVLKNMEENMEGYDYSVKNLVGQLKKTKQMDGFIGVVADCIEIPPEMETAIDIALGRGMQNIIARDEHAVKNMLQILKQNKMGRVTFLPLENLNENATQVDAGILKSEGYLGLASELIQFDKTLKPAVDYLLGRTLIFRDYDSASKALRIKSNRLRMVTLDGELLIPGGAITGGSVKQKTTGVLNRKVKIEQLEKDLTRLQSELKKMEADTADNKHDLERLKVKKETVELDQRAIESALQAIVLEKQSLDSHLEQNKQALIRTDKNQHIIDEELKKIEVRYAELSEKLQEKHRDVEMLELSIQTDGDEQTSLTSQLESLGEEKTTLAIRLASIQEKLGSAEKEKDRIEKLLNSHRLSIEEKAQSMDTIKSEKGCLLEEKSALLERKADLKVSIEAIKDKITILGDEKERLRTEAHDKSSALKLIHEQMQSISQKLHSLEIEHTKWTVERESVIRNIETQYEMLLEDAKMLKKPLDEKVVSVRAKQIKARIKELGDVNLGSIAEYEEVTERYHFMREQMDDLIHGQNVLKKMIKELDATMITQFSETFEAIRLNFVEVFKQLFNGGTADLKIVDEENILESDIEIYAQPPGKKLQNLNLLSGGEKALTAIALLFSTLKHKPAPFCMLDEIEAALDDVNVYRFAEFLKVFSADSQFVIITHRKGTMEIADRLYGVTMEEYGVSKIVSVKLEDVSF